MITRKVFRVMLFRFFLFVLSVFASVSVQAAEITEADLRQHIEILASDEYFGRKPGTEGENKTVNYIATKWAEAGLVAAAKPDGWYAPVNLVERIPVKQTAAFFINNTKRKKTFHPLPKHILLRGSEVESSLSNTPLVYVGLGNGDPADLKGAVSGKLAIISLRSPKDAEDFPDYRTRKAGLIEAGAIGIITVIKGKSRWRRSARRYRKGGTTLKGGLHHAQIEAIMTDVLLKKVLKKAGMDARQIIADAEGTDFEPILLPIEADISVDTVVREYISHNVVGKIAGSRPDKGAVLFLGHWDHFGECRAKNPENPEQDRICNGAVDNASGISLLIEVAKRLVSSGKPDRDIYFLATTAEEKGLLGARAFVVDPAFALDRLVAVFNADTIALSPTGKKIAVVGRGETELDEDIEKIAKAEGREIDKNDDANAFLKRQDGYVFLENKIPAFMITSAFSDEERLTGYLKGRYHDVSDEADGELILGGAAADANFHVALGRYFANIATYPQKPSSDNVEN